MKINIYIIDKKSKQDLYAPLLAHYQKSCRQFARVEIHEIFNKEIAKAHDISAEAAQKQYSMALKRYTQEGHSVVLDPASREVDSYQFADLLKDRGVVNFFIGGAYGFERGFVDQSNSAISFGKITLSHKLVKVVLMEQIFRGLTILHHHPYHK